MFYPAGAGCAERPDRRSCAAARGPTASVAPKVVVAPHAGLVYSGAVAATAFGPWARRAEPPRRIVIVGPAHRVAFPRDRDPSGGEMAHAARRGAVAPGAHAELARAPGVVVDARPFAGEHSLEMHLVMLQAMLPAPFEIVPILVGDADPQCVAEALRRVWGGPETVIAVSSDLSHFLDQRSAEGDRLRHRPADRDARRRRARRAPRLRLPADQGRARYRRRARHARKRRCIWRHRRTRAPTPRGSSATALSHSNMRPRRGLPRPIASVCFRPAWPRSAWRRGPAARRPRRASTAESPALSPWRATFVTLTENEPASRLHRFAQAPSAAHRGCARQHGAGGLRRSALSAAERVRTGRASPRRLDPLPPAAHSCGKRSPNSRARSSPTATGSFSRPAGAAPCSCRASGATLPDARAFVRHLMAKAGLETNRWPEGLEAKRFRVESFGAPWRRTIRRHPSGDERSAADRSEHAQRLAFWH